jgi:hypothetical protein
MLYNIPVYKAERQLGLTEKVRASASIAYATEILLAPEVKDIQASTIAQSISRLRNSELLKSIASNEGQYDLHYLKSVLATTGKNENDDVFDRVETWMARATPEDKPFNLEHDPHQVIGHITGNYAIDDKGQLLADDADVDSLPAQYHIVTSSVLYKFLKCIDTKLEEQMTQIIAEIKEGKWYVSMEALFNNFDYAVYASDGKQYVVPRNEESAFLTKHLRAYGGDGIYENHHIARLMRNITFSGKGLVRKPANKKSVIFAEVAPFVASAKELGYSIVSDKNIKEKIIMASEVTQVELLQNEIKRLEASMKASSDKNSEYEKQLKELDSKQVQARLTALENDVKSRDDKLAALAAQVKTEQDARTSAETKLKEANDKLAVADKQVAEAKINQIKTERINQWKIRTGAEEAIAVKAVETLVKLSDEEFKSFLETQPAKADVPVVDDKTKKSGSQNADTQVLDAAKPDGKDAAALSTAGVNKDVEATRATLSKFVAENFLHKKGAKNTQGDE